MVTIPSTRDDRRPTPSGYSPINRPTVVDSGRGALGAGLRQAGDAALNVADELERGREQQDAFEVQRRFQQFEAEQRQSFVQRQGELDPREVGFRNTQDTAYKKAADEFFKTVPDHLKPQYEGRLFSVETRLGEAAYQYEREARRGWLGAEREDGLAHIEGKIFSNPDDYEDSLAEGMELIGNLPDDVFTQAEKLEFARQWKDSTRLAVLNGVTPQERIRLLGGIPEVGGVDAGTLANANRMKPEIKGIITEAAARYGVPAEAMLVVAWLESKGNPSAKNPNSSAEGLFQQVSANASEYGVDDPSDAAQSADGAARFMRDNTAKLWRVLGRDPTVGELYLAHQQGPGGAIKLLTNPDALAVDLVGREEIELNGGNVEMTAGEFAQIWLKKAGDTHVPDGGLMRAAYNPDQADSRFTDISYSDAQSIIATAQKAIGDEYDALDKQAEYDRALYSAQLGIAVTAGEATQQDVTSALQSGLITPQRYETLSEQLITQGRKQEKDTEDLQSLMTRVEAGQTGNSFSGEDRNAANQIDDELQTRFEDDPEALNQARVQILRETNVAPEGLAEELRGGMAAGDPQAFDMAVRSIAAGPEAFAGVSGGADVVKKAREYQTLTATGMSAEAAASRLNPNERERMSREAMQKTVRAELGEITVDDIVDNFDSWIPFDRPSITPMMSVEMRRDFETVYRVAREDGMSPQEAEAHASRLLTDPTIGLYGASAIGSGSRGADVLTPEGEFIRSGRFKTESTVMRLPPERFYPPIDGGHEYLKKDIQNSLKSLRGDGAGAWFLVPDETETDAHARALSQGINAELPGYRLYYETEDGSLDFAYWRVTEDEITKLQEKETARNEKAFDEEKRRIDVRRAVENGAAHDALERHRPSMWPFGGN